MADKKKVLVVDDSNVVASILTEALENEGFLVIRAENGIEGVEKAYSEIPDLIIMDVEMPLLMGYQASRLLKQRRGVKEIPILMHTSLSEDRDKYWAINSGVDAFVTKNFDNLEKLILQVNLLIEHPPFKYEIIKDDAKKITRSFIFEIMGSIFDQHLFQSTILNMLGDVGRNIEHLDETILKIMDLSQKVGESHIITVMLKYNKLMKAYVWVGPDLVHSDMEEFLNFCYNDTFKHFPDVNFESINPEIYNIEARDDFKKVKLNKKKISSYEFLTLRGKGGKVIGTLHLGNIKNNYYSDSIMYNINVLTNGAGIIVENSILFNQVSELTSKIKTVFAKFVPREIIDDLVERQAGGTFLTGEKRNVVILFSDIRSFTTISENNTAENVVNFLNNYFDVMVNIIEEEGGTIDKFIGDAILAIFGAPKSYEDNEARALRAAMRMIQSLKQVHIDGMVLPDNELKIGIGLHEGPVIVGNIGSSDKVDYTVIGDTVNLASRLEGLTTHYKQQIIISDTLYEKVKDAATLRELDIVKVKGKTEATSIYGVEFNTAALTKEFKENYQKGLQCYKMGNWSSAIDYFTIADKQKPKDYSVNMFLERCQDYQENPPEQWDGAISLDFK